MPKKSWLIEPFAPNSNHQGRTTAADRRRARITGASARRARGDSSRWPLAIAAAYAKFSSKCQLDAELIAFRDRRDVVEPHNTNGGGAA